LIRIDIKKQGPLIEEVRVNGHAGGKEGTDIVCAAVSAVTQTTLAGLLHHSEEQVNWSTHKGQLTIQIPSHIEARMQEIAQILLSTMLIGLEQISRSYPQRVAIYINAIRVKHTSHTSSSSRKRRTP